MKKHMVLFVLLCVALGATAQSTHTATLSWTAPSGTITGYNVYRGACTGTITGSTCSQEATAALVGQVLAGTTTYDDSGLAAGAKVYWYVTAYVDSATQTGESAPSNHFAAAIPKDVVTPNAPSGLSVAIK